MKPLKKARRFIKRWVRLKRRSVTRHIELRLALARQPQALKEAKDAFKTSDPTGADALLHSLESADGRAMVLASRMALFASNFEEAEYLANQATWSLPSWSRYAKQAFYLRQEALRKLNRHQQARDLFYNVPFEDPSNRFYQAFRLSVDSEAGLPFYEAQCRDLPLYGARWRRATSNYLLLLRNLGQADKAIKLAQIRHEQLANFFEFGQLRSNKKRSKGAKERWIAKAGQALKDLDLALREHGVELFLISGTLLGCVREGTILGHDKDIDVGVSDQFTRSELQEFIKHCPVFKEREIESANAVYLEHVNKVFVDVFIHYNKDANTVAHGGLKTEWTNTPFEVKQVDFLGHRYGAPADSNLYLEENYGDWRTPKPEFETFTDTPNMLVLDQANFELYCIMAATNYYLTGDSYRLEQISVCSGVNTTLRTAAKR